MTTTTPRNPRLGAIVAVALILAMVLAACGGDDSGASLPAGDDGRSSSDDALGSSKRAEVGHPEWLPDDLLPADSRFYEDGDIGGVEGAGKAASATVDEPDPMVVATTVSEAALENGYELQGQNGDTIVSLFRADTGSIILEFKALDGDTQITVLLSGSGGATPESDESATSAGTASVSLDGTEFDVAGTCVVTRPAQQFDSDDGRMSIQFDASSSPATVTGSFVGDVDGTTASLNFDSGTPLGAKIESSEQASGFVLQGPMINQFSPADPPFNGVVSVVCGG